jgi:hypothetical protein
MTDGLDDQIFDRLTEMLDDAEIEQIMPPIIEALSDENKILFLAAQFLGREALLSRDKRVFYASSALLAITGMLGDVMGDEVGLGKAMDYADECFDESLEAFDGAIESMTNDALKEMGM